jgi:hypothetical protein
VKDLPKTIYIGRGNKKFIASECLDDFPHYSHETKYIRADLVEQQMSDLEIQIENLKSGLYKY